MVRSVNDPRSAFRPATGEIPTAPGVYRFSDASGRALYIGKAKNLRARLSSYFGPLEALNPRIQRMLLMSHRVDWTVVRTDTESLILEHTWINEMSPPFNVQFRDDKSYPYLAITLADEAPRLIVTRKRNIRGARYFGPFPRTWAVRETAGLLQQAFPIRTCNDATYKRAMSSGIPCLASQIGRCAGPCSLAISLDEHAKHVGHMIAFLSGQDTSELNALREQMRLASHAQNYEGAAKLRDQITAAEHVLEKNSIVLRDSTNADVFGLVTDELAACVHQFIVRNGRVRGERSWIVDIELDTSAEELISNVLKTAYLTSAQKRTRSRRSLVNTENADYPSLIVSSVSPADAATVTELLEREFGRRVSVEVPIRGEKQQIVQRAQLNAAENLQRYKMRRASDIVTRTDALAELQRFLGLNTVPLVIECVDVSHLSGSNVVGSLVRFEDGLPAKSGYRHYRIDGTNDDTASIRQLVTRRYGAVQDSSSAITQSDDRRMPQLLVVDGGQPQVAAAKRALTELGMSELAICGIAKRLEEIWLPDEDFPRVLPRTSEALFLVQRMRDEAHRFAITYQRKQRAQSVHSQLADVPGLGEKRVASLLKTFKSVARLRRATTDEIASAPGISTTLAETIFEFLNSSQTPEK